MTWYTRRQRIEDLRRRDTLGDKEKEDTADMIPLNYTYDNIGNYEEILKKMFEEEAELR
jgi:hypothetical protein